VEASPGFAMAFVALVLVVAALLPLGVAHAGGGLLDAAVATGIYRGAVGAVAVSGALEFGPLPPRLLLLVALCFAGTAALAFSPLGARLATRVPLAWLIGYQAFRVPVELLLHRGFREGFVPEQMTYLGANFDVASGAGALIVAFLVARGAASPRLVLAWNVAALALLANIVAIAVLSMPTPLRVFQNEPANVWVARFPWIWLPTVLVQAAWLGHLLVFRALRAQALLRRPPRAADPEG
jgi:hypothetical protein